MANVGVCLLVSYMLISVVFIVHRMEAVPVSTEAPMEANATVASLDQMHFPWGNIKINLPDFSKLSAMGMHMVVEWLIFFFFSRAAIDVKIEMRNRCFVVVGNGSAGCSKSGNGKGE
jgi:hypothetical protein